MDQGDELKTLSITSKALKAQFSKLAMREQEQWSPEDYNLRALLKWEPDRVYTGGGSRIRRDFGPGFAHPSSMPGYGAKDPVPPSVSARPRTTSFHD